MDTTNNNGKILNPDLVFSKDRLIGKTVSYSSRTIGVIKSLFEDKDARMAAVG